jgi:hypothetical protein
MHVFLIDSDNDYQLNEYLHEASIGSIVKNVYEWIMNLIREIRRLVILGINKIKSFFSRMKSSNSAIAKDAPRELVRVPDPSVYLDCIAKLSSFVDRLYSETVSHRDDAENFNNDNPTLVVDNVDIDSFVNCIQNNTKFIDAEVNQLHLIANSILVAVNKLYDKIIKNIDYLERKIEAMKTNTQSRYFSMLTHCVSQLSRVSQLLTQHGDNILKLYSLEAAQSTESNKFRTSLANSDLKSRRASLISILKSRSTPINTKRRLVDIYCDIYPDDLNSHDEGIKSIYTSDNTLIFPKNINDCADACVKNIDALNMNFSRERLYYVLSLLQHLALRHPSYKTMLKFG